MIGHRRSRPVNALSLAATMCAVIALVVSTGCGGGGGGGGTQGTYFGRSYTYSAGGNVLAISVDNSGRFTAFIVSPGSAPSGAGVQGSVSSSGSFSGTSADGALQLSGQVATGGGSISSATVKAGAQTLFTAANVTAVAGGAATPANALGTFTATSASPAYTVYVTGDATSHATLWANDAGTIGGGQFAIPAGGGAFQTADGSTAGQWNFNNTSGVNLTLTKLGGQTVNLQVTVARTGRAKWTFLVYLNAANNLRDFGPINFNQMEEVGSSSNVNIVVQWKQAQCSDCGSSSWNSTRRYYVTKNNDFTNSGGLNGGTDMVQSTLVQDLGANVDMGNYNTLHNFILWGQQNYPADHYALVIWDHGAGWYNLRAAVRKPTRALSFDDAFNTEIEVWQLSQALNVTPQVDTVIFDCSLMQMTETNYEIRNSTSVIVGSEESPPGYGYPYDLILSDLTANPTWTASQLGSDIVRQTLTFYTNNQYLNPGVNNTQSAIDATKMSALGTAINNFANSLITHASTNAAQLAAARNAAENYDPSAGYGDFKDLYDYCAQVKAQNVPSDLQSSATAVQQALQAAVILNQHGPGHPKSNGLSIYVPSAASYLSSYGNLALAKDTRWPAWLQAQPQ